MDENEVLQTLNYTISVDEYERAFIIFQKRYVFPKNYIMTALFGVIIVLYIQQLFTDPTYMTAWILGGVCLVFIALIWYNAFKIRRSLMRSIKDIADDRYTTAFLPDGLRIQTEIAVTDEAAEEYNPEPRKISYINDKVQILENGEMFILYLKKQMFYVIPKRCLSESEIAFLGEEFAEKLQKDFIRLKK